MNPVEDDAISAAWTWSEIIFNGRVEFQNSPHNNTAPSVSENSNKPRESDERLNEAQTHGDGSQNGMRIVGR
jgi:hypothetical protein